MNLESRLPLLLNRWLKHSTATAAIVALLAGGAFAQVKSAPRQNPVGPQILIEMKVIAAPEGTAGFFGAKPASPPPMLSAEEFQAGWRKLQEMKGVDILSAPKVVTLSGQRATIEIGAAKGSPKPAGMKFDVLPTLASDGSIQLDFDYTNASLKEGKIQTRVLKTNASVPSGHTLLIGGASEEGRITLIAVTASLAVLPGPQ